MSTLLDVNVLIALLDGDHLYSEAAHRWFDSNAAQGWAACPLTQNGVLRVIGHPRYPNSPGGPEIVARLLHELQQFPGFEFWPDDISILDEERIARSRLGSHARLTDTYLLALAAKHKGRFATFDRRLSPDAVTGGREALVVI